MDQSNFDAIVEAMREWELSRTLVKGCSIFPPVQSLNTPSSCFSACEVEISEFLPEGMDYFLIPNSSRVVMSPVFWQRLKAFIDDHTEAIKLTTVA